MKQEELQRVLKEHKKWLKGEGRKRADLRYADLLGADLSKADLRYADLLSADLRCADLLGADLRGANLSNADLSRADLSGANLRCAILSKADLRDVNLTGANLTGANLTGAKLNGIKGYDVISIQMNTSVKNRQIQYIPEMDRCIVGCFHGTLEELKIEVEKTHKDNLGIKNRYMKTIKFIEELAKEYEEEK